MSKYKNVELVKPSGLELKDRLVSVNRVTKVTKGGRAFGFSAIVVVGDENGVVGHGLGKSKDVSEAIAKAVEDAKKNLVRIPLRGQSVPHEQKGKFGGARVFLMPASHGTGVIALGLRKMGQVVEHDSNPAILGMINKVKHLVSVEEVK